MTLSTLLLGKSIVKKDGATEATCEGGEQQFLDLKFANRHGLIAGATGTGKTVSLQILAEGFSRAGVPTFVADVKGDLSGISQAGKPHPKVDERLNKIGITDYEQVPNPVVFWDLYGEKGHKLRATIHDMGPILLARLLNLSDAQEGVITIAFMLAEEQKMALIDLNDLRSLLIFMAENATALSQKYGGVDKRSVSSIQRKLLQLQQQGADQFFGEPAVELKDLIRTVNFNGDMRGVINVLDSTRLINSPKMYSTFLLWLMSELFEQLPEQGDADKPKMVFFFDEAHLLFDDAPKILTDKVEQVVRLIRSKGVGIYFITQSPIDIPVDVLGQLGNKVQHALRAFTPKDKKAVKTAADTFRQNPDLKTTDIITQMGVGEALISTLEEKGSPSIVQHTLICPPQSRIGPATDAERREIMQNCDLRQKYSKDIDRESAFEILQKKREAAAKLAQKEAENEGTSPLKKAKKKSSRQGYGETIFKSILRRFGTGIGKALIKFLPAIIAMFMGRKR